MLLRTRLEYLNTKSAIAVIELHGHLEPPLTLAAGQAPATATKATTREKTKSLVGRFTFTGSDVKQGPSRKAQTQFRGVRAKLRATNSGLKHLTERG